MDRVLVGTSGYSYKDWKGVLYPEALPQTEFLRYYALQFPFVELNFSYYTMPQSRAVESLVHKTPKQFLFSIKANKALTHERGSDWREQAKNFMVGIEPLAANDRLAGVLIQLPYSFHYREENRLYLAGLLDELASFPCYVEFRNEEWYADRVYEELERRRTGLVMVDTPELEGLPLPRNLVFGGKAYIRMHGRNAQNWWEGDATSRYDYEYTVEELEGWLPRIHSMSQKAVLFIAFNNHSGGKAVRNAQKLTELVKERLTSA